MREKDISVAVDVVIQREEEVLLIKRKNAPFLGQWALPGGFIEKDEEVLTAALRELREETNATLTEDTLEFIGYFDAPDRDPRGRIITFAFGTQVNGTIPVTPGDDAWDARWFSIHDLPDMAFDHRTILAQWLEY